MIVAGGDGFPKIVSSLLKVPGIGGLYSWCNCSMHSKKKLAAQLVDPHHPGDFNQSLMELGATLCTPANAGALTNSKLDKLVLITDYPAKSIKLKQRHEFSARPDEGLLAGLWEFPSVMLGKEADLTRRRKEMNLFLKKSFRLDPQKTCSVLLRKTIGEFIHIFHSHCLKGLCRTVDSDMSDLFSKQSGERYEPGNVWIREALSKLGIKQLE
uniref:Adenine glycosylase n=1 Tax=Populus alba TaxID=43335 RepID=A0A4V6ACD1_POPAL|nr:hypothetical protein D5086_0000000250 [Populus alba]